LIFGAESTQPPTHSQHYSDRWKDAHIKGVELLLVNDRKFLFGCKLLINSRLPS